MINEKRIEDLEVIQNKTLEIVTELKMAICGSEKIGVEGIINKVRKHESYIENDKKQKWMIAGGVIVISFILGLLVTLWNKIF